MSSSYAWLPPERCAQGKTHGSRRTFAATITTGIEEPTIETIAANQLALLKETYKNHQFVGVPIRAQCTPGTTGVFIYAPYNCTFHTYDPRLLSSVACQNTACKLIHTVSTIDTYTSFEGYNWGVKISAKASFLGNTFEVGGEVSASGTYTCTYTKGRTATDIVECSEPSGKQHGNLQLYNVKSDMECDFGRITLEEEPRDSRLTVTSPKNHFSKFELQEIEDSAAARFEPCREIIIDTNKISDRLFQKMMKTIPLFNPYTDMVLVNFDTIMVRYFKKTEFIQEYRKIIPFTTEGGDSVFQYGCMLTSF